MRLLFMSTVTILLLFAAFVTATDIPPTGETSLPIGLTEEELGRLHEIGMNHRATAPPTGTVRNPAEWERSQGVIIRWPLGISYSLVAEMSEALKVTTIVGSASQEASARSAYTSSGVNMANVDFIIAATNSIWTRDYGPWFIFSGDRIGIVDHVYNRPRPLDDVIPQTIGNLWNIPVYGMNLITAGGNHMSDGLGRSMSTHLVYDENPSLSHNQVDSLMLAYLGNDYTVLEYIESGGIHHIDCWAKFLDPGTILVKDVPTGSASYSLLNARAAFLATQMSAWGRPYEIVRIYCPTGTAYTNSIILNDKVLVPIFGSAWDDDALATYEQAMPGYEVIGFTGSWLDDDAIHCRTMGVPDTKMLYVRHVPLSGAYSDTLPAYEVSAYIDDYSRTGLIADSLLIRYRVDTGAWLDVPLLSVAPDSFAGAIPAQAGGSLVEYFVLAADNSGRVETHPFIGAPGAHSFVVNAAPLITSPDSFLVRGGVPFAFCPTVNDPDNATHTISFSGYPAWLAVNDDTLSGVAPEARTQSSFVVTVADPFTQVDLEVAVFTYLCGDADDSGDGPNVGDLTFLVNYLFRAGPPPPLPVAANVDGSPDGAINVGDLTALVEYLFRGGPAPGCGD